MWPGTWSARIVTEPRASASPSASGRSGPARGCAAILAPVFRFSSALPFVWSPWPCVLRMSVILIPCASARSRKSPGVNAGSTARATRAARSPTR